jgi:hypothetical protein
VLDRHGGARARASAAASLPRKGWAVPIADLSFGDVVVLITVFFVFLMFLFLLFIVFADLFSRHDISGWDKAVWVVLVLIVPFIGIVAYLVFETRGIAERASSPPGRTSRT